MKPLIPLLFSFSLLLFSSPGFGAACCGGGFAAPSIIAGDEKALLTLSASQSEVTTDVHTNGLWKKREEAEDIQTLKIEGAHLLSDRWHAGFSLPLTKRNRAQQVASGFGDLNTSLGYEYLPDWDYNPLRPKGVGFLQLTIPTGRSIYESENPLGLDSQGRGFWALGMGTLLTKTWSKLDAFANFEIHRSFDKSLDHDGVQGTLKPGWGHTLGMGAGINTTNFRFGSSLTWMEEGAVNLVGSQNSSGAAQRYATGALSVSYLANDEVAGTLSYSDQALFGSPSNTSLGQTLSLQLQRKWAR